MIWAILDTLILRVNLLQLHPQRVGFRQVKINVLFSFSLRGFGTFPFPLTIGGLLVRINSRFSFLYQFLSFLELVHGRGC